MLLYILMYLWAGFTIALFFWSHVIQYGELRPHKSLPIWLELLYVLVAWPTLPVLWAMAHIEMDK